MAAQAVGHMSLCPTRGTVHIKAELLFMVGDALPFARAINDRQLFSCVTF